MSERSLKSAAEFMIEAMMDEKQRKFEKQETLLSKMKSSGQQKSSTRADSVGTFSSKKTLVQEVAELHGLVEEEADEHMRGLGF